MNEHHRRNMKKYQFHFICNPNQKIQQGFFLCSCFSAQSSPDVSPCPWLIDRTFCVTFAFWMMPWRSLMVTQPHRWTFLPRACASSSCSSPHHHGNKHGPRTRDEDDVVLDLFWNFCSRFVWFGATNSNWRALVVMCWEWMLQLIFETLFICMPTSSCISVSIGFVNYTIFNNICIQSLPDPAIFRLNFQDSYFQWFQRNGLHALAKSWKKTLPLSMTELLQGMLTCDSEQRPNVDMCDLEDFFLDDFGGLKEKPYWCHMAKWKAFGHGHHFLTWFDSPNRIRWLQLETKWVITRVGRWRHPWNLGWILLLEINLPGWVGF